MVGGVKATFTAIIVFSVAVGCGKKELELRSERVITPDEAANELFVVAVELVSEAQSKETTDTPASIKSYEQALVKVREITNKHKKSDLAVKLVSGETLFTGKSLAQHEKRVSELQRELARRAEEEKRQNLFEGDGAARLLKEKEFITQIPGYLIHIGEQQPTGDKEGELKLKEVLIHQFQGGQLVERIRAARGRARVNVKERKYVFDLIDVEVQSRELEKPDPDPGGMGRWYNFSVGELSKEISYGQAKKTTQRTP